MISKENFPLREKKVVATGKLNHCTRNAFMVMLKDLGAFPTHRVSSKTDVLVVGSKPGKKLEKAHSLGIHILTEAEFERMLFHYVDSSQ